MPPGVPNPMMFPASIPNGLQAQHEMHSQVAKHSFQHGTGAASKIPVFSDRKHFDDGQKKTSFSAPSRTSNTLPPIVGGNQVGSGQTGSNSRGHSNPEKNKKYSKNPR